MKKLVLALLSLFCHLSMTANDMPDHEARTRAGIILTSPLLGLIDGLSFGINAMQIKLMLIVHREVKKIMYGEAKPGGVLEGRYTFANQKLSVKQLVAAENAIETNYAKNRAALLNDPVTNQHAIQQLDLEYHTNKQALRTCLQTVKREFEEKVASFEKNARGAKDQMLVLMTESCQKHGRPNSALLKWADTQEGQEMQYLRNHINSFQEFDLFCTDLLSFLEDLMRSCPKAWNQFKQQLEAAKHNQAHGPK